MPADKRLRLFFLVVVCGLLRSCLATPILLTGSDGTISSENVAGTYPDNVDRTWRITVREGHRVALSFPSFDLEDSYDEELGGYCVYDYVQIDDDEKFCGSTYDTPIGTYYSRGNTMTIRFVSDYSNEAPFPRGFEATWVEEDVNECDDRARAVAAGGDDWESILYCNHVCHNDPGSYHCSCRPGFRLNDNRHTCVAICIERKDVAADEQGNVTSSEYPEPYSKLANCHTLLQAPPGFRLSIRFDPKFAIERHHQEGCVYDWLEVTYTDANTTRYCGVIAPGNGEWIELDSNQVRLYFHADTSYEEAGYKMFYQTRRVRCLEVPRSPEHGTAESTSDNNVFEYEDRIVFECNRGYRMVGSRETVCTADGSWSHPVPTCQLKHCSRYPQVPNAVIAPNYDEEELLPFGTQINVTCSRWYELVSGATKWICEDDETWHEVESARRRNSNGNRPKCRPICGLKKTNLGRIIRGKDVGIGEWPWMAFVYFGNGNWLEGLKAKHNFCGGSLVSERYVVTAAHCIQPLVELNILHRLKVYLGVTNRSAENPDKQEFEVHSTVHPGYNTNTRPEMDNDVAILRLNRKAEIGEYVRPICITKTWQQKSLPSRSSRKGLVLGWGIIGMPSMFVFLRMALDTTTKQVHWIDKLVPLTSQMLKFVELKLQPNSVCSSLLRKSIENDPQHPDHVLSNNNICAGYNDTTTGKDTCKGDSGGPLMWEDRDRGKWFLNGIVSFGTNPKVCGSGVLTAYVNVSNYVDFLVANNVISP